MKDLTDSKRIRVMAFAVVLAVLLLLLKHLWLKEISLAEISLVVSLPGSYILGQSISDIGKGAAQVSADRRLEIVAEAVTPLRPVTPATTLTPEDPRG